MSSAVGQYKVRPGEGGVGGTGVGGVGDGGTGVGGVGGGGVGAGDGPESGHQVPPQPPHALSELQYSPGLLQDTGLASQPA